MPDKNRPTTRLEDANKRSSSFLGSEPVECLSRHYEIHRFVSERCIFRAAANHAEVGVTAQVPLTGLTHFEIRLDADHPIAILQQDLGQQSWTTTDIGCNMLWPQTACPLERLHYLGRIVGTIFHVVTRAVRKPRYRIAYRLGHGCYLIVSDEAPAYFQASNCCRRRRGDPSDSPWTRRHLRCRC